MHNCVTVLCSSWCRTRVSCIAGGFFTNGAIGEAHTVFLYSSNKNILFCGLPMTDKLPSSIIYMCLSLQYFSHYKISL